MNILESLNKRVSFEYLEADGLLLDVGMLPKDIAEMKRKGQLTQTPEFQHRFGEFKAKFLANDELWYYEWKRDAFWGTGGYAIIRDSRVVDSITTWKS